MHSRRCGDVQGCDVELQRAWLQQHEQLCSSKGGGVLYKEQLFIRLRTYSSVQLICAVCGVRHGPLMVTLTAQQEQLSVAAAATVVEHIARSAAFASRPPAAMPWTDAASKTRAEWRWQQLTE